ncbi:uncharacterized protein LOC117901184 isoform X2 [Drosophila subobscura]|uniref:uncharacterized protein LOC117901184 isoform X2 n=1 Tax=Drosophila subobscura TaxID=7241 RepID=UPI00155A094B|nr:uncharacterized protein LOC117901184 isoform X2 [Drosophila subobscura]
MSCTFRYNILRYVQPYSSFVPQLSKSMLRVLIQVSVHYVETKKSCSEVLSLAKSKLTNAGHEVPENFCELFTIVFLIMQIFLRYPKGVVKVHELRQCLLVDLSTIQDKTTVVLHFKLPSGRFRTLELPLSTFQRLRYSITLLLNELQCLQSRSVLK